MAPNETAARVSGAPHVQMLSNPRVPKIMLEGGLCRESERPIAEDREKSEDRSFAYSSYYM
jgi:hypothetical protein